MPIIDLGEIALVTYDLPRAVFAPVWQDRYETGGLYRRVADSTELVQINAEYFGGAVVDSFTGKPVATFWVEYFVKWCSGDLKAARKLAARAAQNNCDRLNRDYAAKVHVAVDARLREEFDACKDDFEGPDRVRWQYAEAPDGTVDVLDTRGVHVVTLPNRAAAGNCEDYLENRRLDETGTLLLAAAD